MLSLYLYRKEGSDLIDIMRSNELLVHSYNEKLQANEMHNLENEKFNFLQLHIE